MARTFSLRHRMLTFVQTMQTYTMVEVLSPHWHEFSVRLDEVWAVRCAGYETTDKPSNAASLPTHPACDCHPQTTTMDQVLDLHRDMLDSCLKECMLSNAKLLEVRAAPSATPPGALPPAPGAITTHYRSHAAVSACCRTQILKELLLQCEQFCRLARNLAMPTQAERRRQPMVRRAPGQGSRLWGGGAGLMNEMAAASGWERAPRQLAPEAEATLERSVGDLGGNFTTWMGRLRSELLVQATEDADQHMVTLAARLDFNGNDQTSRHMHGDDLTLATTPGTLARAITGYYDRPREQNAVQ